MEVDSFDIKILAQLDNNSRQSYSEIGKNIGRSKQFVANRIKKLHEKKIIKGYVLDTALRELGYTVFSIFIQFQKVDKKKEQDIFAYLRKSDYVGNILKTLGNWDIFFSIKAVNIKDFYDFLGDFHNKFSILIKKESINLEVQGISTNLKFLEGKTKPSYLSINTLSEQKKELDKTEKAIFAELRRNPIISYLNLAEKVGKSFDTIKKCIKQMKERNIIKRTRVMVDLTKLGYNRYLFLIDLNFIGKEKMNQFLGYLKNNQNIDYIIESIGTWDIICNVYSKDIYELMEIINNLKEEFKNTIYSIEFLQAIRDEKEIFDIKNN